MQQQTLGTISPDLQAQIDAYPADYLAPIREARGVFEGAVLGTTKTKGANPAQAWAEVRRLATIAEAQADRLRDQEHRQRFAYYDRLTSEAQALEARRRALEARINAEKLSTTSPNEWPSDIASEVAQLNREVNEIAKQGDVEYSRPPEAMGTISVLSFTRNKPSSVQGGPKHRPTGRDAMPTYAQAVEDVIKAHADQAYLAQ